MKQLQIIRCVLIEGFHLTQGTTQSVLSTGYIRHFPSLNQNKLLLKGLYCSGIRIFLLKGLFYRIMSTVINVIAMVTTFIFEYSMITP